MPTSDARELDLVSLKALAHPLRVRILDALAAWGESTASGLGERLRESSGAMSYHLRQLALHNFVREVEGRGTARERWWERTPGPIHIGGDAFTGSEAARAAARVVVDQFTSNRMAELDAFLQAEKGAVPEEWMEASAVVTANLRLTSEELAVVSAELVSVLDAALARHRDAPTPGAMPVQVHLNAFPLLGAFRASAAESR